MLDLLHGITHLSITRCFESPPTFLSSLSLPPNLKFLEIAVPNSDTHVRLLFPTLSSLENLETLHLNLYRSPDPPPSPITSPIPPLTNLKAVIIWAHNVETRRSRQKTPSMFPSSLVELLAISRPKLRSLDLSWTDVAADQLEAVLAACGGTLESIVLSGCNPLASLTLTGLAERIGQYAGPRTLQEIRADYGDADAVLEELRGDIGTLAEVVLGFPRLSTFVVLGPSDSDLEMFAALKRQGDRGAGLLDLKKWEDQKEEEDEVGVFGDGRVGVELGKLRKMGRGL